MADLARALSRSVKELRGCEPQVAAYAAADEDFKTLPDFCEFIGLSPYEALAEISAGRLAIDIHDSARDLGLVEIAADGVPRFTDRVQMLDTCWRYGLISIDAVEAWEKSDSPLPSLVRERNGLRECFHSLNGR